MKSLTRALNFKLELTSPSDGGLWGEDLKNGSYTGLVGDVQTNKVDLGWAGIFLFPERANIIGYTYPTFYDSVCFMVAKSQALPHWLALILPLDQTTWITFGLSLASLLAFFMLVPSIDNSEIDSSSTGALLVVDVILVSSSDIVAKIKSRPLIALLSFMIPSVFIFTTAYRGALTSVLTVDIPEAPMNTAEDLVHQNVKVGSNMDQACIVLAESDNKWHQTLGASCRAFFDYNLLFNKSKSDDMFAISEGKSFLEYTIRERFTNR